jgi:Trk K+ transport system NAD-binding subunit
VTVRDILRSYRSRLQRGARRASVVPGDTVLLELKLGSSSPLIGQTLSEANLPKTTTVVFISRAGETLFPRASTTPAEGDLVGILVSRAAEDELRTLLGRGI